MKKKWKRLWKRILAGFVAIAVVCTSVPVTEVWAAEPDNLAEYDYAKLYSIDEGTVGEYIAGNFKDTSIGNKGQEQKRSMRYGEITYLEFALSYNTDAKVELYFENGERIGNLYGISYTEHVENIGSELSPEYVEKDGMSSSVIRSNLINKAKNGFYSSLGIIYGISLTGLKLPYGTLDEYYEYYGLEKPEEVLEETDVLEETSENDLENQSAADEETETLESTEQENVPPADSGDVITPPVDSEIGEEIPPTDNTEITEDSDNTGILPDAVKDKLVYVGNSSKTGAYMALMSKKAKQEMEKLAEEMEYMELAETENYERIFTDSMIFPTF